MSAVITSVSSSAVTPTPSGIAEENIKGLEKKIELARAAFAGLCFYHDTYYGAHLVGDKQAIAIGELLDEILERTNDVLCMVQEIRPDSGESMLSSP